MKFLRLKHKQGFNENLSSRYTVTDLERSNKQYNYIAGVDRIPRRDSKYWNFRYMIWDVKGNYQISKAPL